MNAYTAFAGSEVWHIAGWTMLHYLWLGALVGIVALISRLLLNRAAPNVRYTVALGWLTLLAALPIAIAAWLIENSPPLQPATAHVNSPPSQGGAKGGFIGAVEPIEVAEVAEPSVIEPNDPTTAPAIEEPATAVDVAIEWADSEPSPGPSLIGRGISLATLESFVPFLPWVWLVGTPVTFALLAAGIVGTKRLRRASRAVDDPRISELLTRLAASLRIGKRVSVAVCERVASPVLVGILRPMILLPPAALTGWSPDEIEMVLLHELAHVRRWDNLVNLIQRLIESLLFFHPAVWLVSNWVRRERETCCDAFVVGRTKRPHAYAELLVALAAQMPRSVLFHPAASSAMSTGPLHSRIRRILQLEKDPMLISGKSLTLMLASLFIAATFALLYLPTIGQAEESTTEVTESTEPVEVPKGDTVEQSEPKTDKNLNPTGPAATAIPIVTELLLREITELQKRKGELEGRLYELQTDFTVMKDRLDEKNAREGQDEPNLELQQLTKKFQIESGASRTQLAEVAKSLAEKMKTLTKETERSVESESPDVESKRLQEKLNGLNATSAEQVFLTLPHNTLNENPQKFIEAFEAAIKQNKHVEIRDRGEEMDLVIIPARDEKTWPKILGEPPRKERVIAEKAWQRLGLKLVPATHAESVYRGLTGRRSGITIVGGNVPKGLPLPSILTSVGGQDVQNMDSLLLWLESEAGRSTTSVKCNAVAGGREYLFDTNLPADPNAAQSPSEAPFLQIGPTNSARHPARPESGVSRFPSLEDQKLADLAWKRLGLELEPIGNDDLKRAQALGYDGGLRVSGRPGVVAKTGADQVGESFLTGDILVGLHVWPTANMQALAEVLNRDDLPELNPLKFYVVRQNRVGDAENPTLQDAVRTGRVSVNLGNGSLSAGGRGMMMGSTPPSVSSAAVSNSEAPSYVLPSVETEAAAPPKSRKRPTRPNNPNTLPLAGGGTPLPVAPGSKSTLRYDGKSFDEWRNEWRTELSVEKRLEAVKALAAFGARGYATEAAETILEVAAEYDVGQIVGNETPEVRLMQAVVDALKNKVPAAAWRPLLRKRFDADPKEWQWLAITALRDVKPTDDNERNETQDFLLELAHNDVSQISSSAISALVKLDPALENDRTKQVVLERLNSDQLEVVRGTVSALSRWAPQNPPELIDLLLHGDAQRQQLMRQALDRSAPWKSNLALVDSLVAVLKDEAKAADHVAAIRTLAVLGQAAGEAESNPVEVLQTIVKNGSVELQIAAAVAVGQIPRSQIGDWPQLTGKLRDANGNDLDSSAIQKLTQNEIEEVFGKNANR